MTQSGPHDPGSLQAEIARLRRSLAQLADMARQGLPVTEAQARAQERLSDLESRLAAAGGPAGSDQTAFDQQAQQVTTQLNVAHLYQVYQTAPGRTELSEAAFGKVLEDYLGWVVREYGHTRLHGLQTLQRTGSLDRPLAQVYTSLAVQHRPAVTPGGEAAHRPGRLGIGEEGMADQARPLDMADLLTLGERIAIVGGAGSGKTTYLSFVAASLAAALRGQALDVRLKPPAPDVPLPVPLLAPLRYWQVYRDQCAQKSGLLVDEPDAGSLGAFLLWFLRARYKNFAAAADFFERLLRGGQGCLILLDGLDEVVNVDQRRTVRDGVDHLLRSQYPGNRCLVTAREAGYRDAPFGGDFIRCDVQAMDEEQIAALVGAWCGQIYPQPHDREVACDDLLGAIGELNAERRARNQPPLIATPLMVTMVVSVRYSRRELPRERAKLYDACVDVVLGSEYTGREDDAGARRGVVTAGGPPDKQREWLSHLAFHMHLGGQAGASLDEKGVRAVLDPALAERGEADLLDPFLAATRHRGGLFEERGDRFQFSHLTFQEYLAAQYLARQWTEQSPGFLVEVATDDWWREALLLTVGSLGPPTPYERRRAFVAALCELDGSFPARLAAAELAASGLADLTDPEPTLQALARRRLVDLLAEPALSEATPPARAAAGRALAALGDPRNLEELVEVPAGPFLMGTPEKDVSALLERYGGEREWYGWEVPQHETALETYRIGKYPVTNARFRAFVQSGGYREPRYWPEAQAAGLWQDGRLTCYTWSLEERKYEKGTSRGPHDYGPPFNLPNHPVVGVSWYEALACCRWLTEVWREEGMIGPAEWVRLPTEAEWEKAARGTDGWIFPWGDRFDPAKCNMGDSGIRTTSALGLFPAGASPYGLEETSGSVWEWTMSLWGHWTGEEAEFQFPYPYDPADGREDLAADPDALRVVRGGAFDNDGNGVRCAVRDWYFPLNRYDNLGFRIVVSLHLPPLPSGPPAPLRSGGYSQPSGPLGVEKGADNENG